MNVNAMVKGFGFVFGVPLLFGIAYFYFALSTGEKRMTAVCDKIKPGTTLAQLKELAEEHGLVVPRADSGVAYLAESRTYGRFACRVTLDAGIVKRSEYHFAD